MNRKSIRFFNDREVRAVWDDEHNCWWFSATDVVRAINDEPEYTKDCHIIKFTFVPLKRYLNTMKKDINNIEMEHNTPIDPEKLKDLLELVNKSPEVIRLKQECDDINAGKRNEISQKIIDNAFDAFEIIVKNFSEDQDAIVKLQKFFSKHLFCFLLNCKNITIKD